MSTNLAKLQAEYTKKLTKYKKERVYWLVESDKNPSIRPYLIEYAARNQAWFCNVWIYGYNPRVAPYLLPFVLFDRQEEMLEFINYCYDNKRWGTVAKCRYTGASYITCMWMLHSLMFKYDFAGTLASNKADSVDKSNSSKSLFYNIMDMYKRLPDWMKSFDMKKSKTRMLIYNEDKNSSIVGESGKEIGRGGRSSMAMIDESAFVEADNAMVAALSENTDCAMFISTPNGMSNEFYRLVNSPVIETFYYYWHADPRRSEEWRKEQDLKLGATIAAQELDVSFDATNNASFIENEWVQACVNAHEKIEGMIDYNDSHAGLDVALGGDFGDSTILTIRRGAYVEPQYKIDLRDTSQITKRVFEMITHEMEPVQRLMYDGDGLGAGVTAAINELDWLGKFEPVKINGAGSVSNFYWLDRDASSDEFLANQRAECWYSLRERIRKTYLVVTGQKDYPVSELISLPDDQELLLDLLKPQFKYKGVKMLLESKKDMKKRGLSSPDKGDSLAYCCKPGFINPWLS